MNPHPSFCSGSRQRRADQSHFSQVLHVIPSDIHVEQEAVAAVIIIGDVFVNSFLLLRVQ